MSGNGHDAGTSPALTELQLSLLKVLWERGEATVGDVQQALQAASRPLAGTTIATLLSRLEKRGIVAYRTEGRQYVYRALVGEAETRGSVLAEVTDRLFAGDVAMLVSELLTSRDLRDGDLERVKALIAEKERELAGRRS
jgi:BlaI family transcriptional regulator, penicillinase repressor